MSTDGNQALKPYRVLDLTDEKGHLCGKIFADLGAEVIKIEPPEGDSARRKSPGSLFCMAYNTGNKSVTLDISKKEDEDKLLMLVKSADFLIESFSPGYLKSIGLEYSALEKINPGLIMASITPFGQTGPRANWKCPDLICWAMGGYM